jgi:hypothetical protein
MRPRGQKNLRGHQCADSGFAVPGRCRDGRGGVRRRGRGAAAQGIRNGRGPRGGVESHGGVRLREQ